VEVNTPPSIGMPDWSIGLDEVEMPDWSIEIEEPDWGM
jgi:hypothetical protein